MVLRRAQPEDKARVLLVEQKSTRNLRYLPAVFDHWVHDAVGELSVVLLDDELVGVGKFTVMPDGSAWLEALRVSEEAQGKGVGKRFYQRFFELARQQGISTMRMYTGIGNQVSRGLAERHGFHLAATFRGASRQVTETTAAQPIVGFQLVQDGARAAELLLPLAAKWNGMLVMNRTFYAVTPELCQTWAKAGKIYYDVSTSSLLVLGARFQADLGLHVACMSGDLQKCLDFAEERARELKVPKLHCLFAPEAKDVEQALIANGYQFDHACYIVEEVTVQKG